MTERDDEFLLGVLAAYRLVEPSRDEIARVVQASADVRSRPWRRLVPRLAPAFASIALIVALAVPGSRGALAAGFDQVRSFLAGGETPGRALDASETQLLAALEQTTEGSPRVLARAGEEILTAYREEPGARACFQFGLSASTCFDVNSLQPKFIAAQVAPLLVTPTRTGDAQVLWGLTGDRVASVELRDADGTLAQSSVGQNGFITIVPIDRWPVEIVARDQAGDVIARGPLPADLGWSRR
jgi:hypothetical protein